MGLALKWNNPKKSGSCNSRPVSCKLSTPTSRMVSLSLPISFTLPFVIPSPTVMSLHLSVTTPFSAGLLFNRSLRLQCNGYTIRLAAWAGEGFKEGVSLTVYDELARWEKYAYGCNELLFHPIRKWIYKGPFTPLFRTFLFSNIRFTSKITIISYIGTYYAIGAAWIMTTANYFAIGWFNGYLDKYYVD